MDRYEQQDNRDSKSPRDVEEWCESQAVEQQTPQDPSSATESIDRGVFASVVVEESKDHADGSQKEIRGKTVANHPRYGFVGET